MYRICEMTNRSAACTLEGTLVLGSNIVVRFPRAPKEIRCWVRALIVCGIARKDPRRY